MILQPQSDMSQQSLTKDSLGYHKYFLVRHLAKSKLISLMAFYGFGRCSSRHSLGQHHRRRRPPASSMIDLWSAVSCYQYRLGKHNWNWMTFWNIMGKFNDQTIKLGQFGLSSIRPPLTTQIDSDLYHDSIAMESGIYSALGESGCVLWLWRNFN